MRGSDARESRDGAECDQDARCGDSAWRDSSSWVVCAAQGRVRACTTVGRVVAVSGWFAREAVGATARTQCYGRRPRPACPCGHRVSNLLQYNTVACLSLKTGGALPTGSHWGLPSTGVAVGFFNRGARSFPGPRTLPGHQSDGAWRRDSTVGRGWPGAHGDDAHPRGRRRLRVPHLRQPQQLQRHQDRERPPAVWSPAGVSNYKPAASTSHRWAPIYTLGLPRVPSSLAGSAS